MTEAPKEEQPEQAKESQFFMIEGKLQDAWGRTVDPDADEPIDFNESQYKNMKAPELKAEIKRRQAEGREFDTGQLKTKADAVSALEADDAKRLQEAKDVADDDEDEDENQE